MAHQSSHRGLPVVGLFLIAIGLLLLLQTLGVLSWGIWWNLWRLWPVLLVIAGVSVLLGRRAPLLASGIIILLVVGSVGAAAWISDGMGSDKERVSELREPLNQTEALGITIKFGAGTVTLGDLPASSPNLIEAMFRSSGGSRKAAHSLTRLGKKVELVLERTGSEFWGRSVTQDWEVLLSQDVTIELDVQSGASDMTIDLENLRVTDFRMATGASKAHVVLPGATEFTSADIDVGAASLTITIPEGVAARIDTDAGLASVDIDGRRFPKVNGHRQSPDYETATHRLDLDIDGGVADIEVR